MDRSQSSGDVDIIKGNAFDVLKSGKSNLSTVEILTE